MANTWRKSQSKVSLVELLKNVTILMKSPKKSEKNKGIGKGILEQLSSEFMEKP